MQARVRLLVLLSVLLADLCFVHGQTVGDRSIESVRAMLERGAYADAEQDARKLIAAASATHADALEVARLSNLLVQALVRNGKAADPSTLTLAQTSLKDLERQVDPSHLLTTSALHTLAAVHVERGEFGVALLLHQKALSIRQETLPPSDSRIADSFDSLADTLMQMERFDDARRAIEQSEAIRRPKSEVEPLSLARTLELKAWLYRYSGDYQAGQEPVDRAMAVRTRHSPGHPDFASTLKVHGDILWLQGKHEAGRTAWTDGLKLIERTLGLAHPATVGFYRRLALASDTLGDRDETRRLLDRGLRVAELSLAPCNPDLMAIRAYWASSLVFDADYTEARRHFRRVLTTYERCLGPEHSRTMTILYTLASCTAELGDYDEAERLHERVIRVWAGRLGATHPYVARGWDALAEVAAKRGQVARARMLYERSLSIRRQRVGEDHPDVAWTLTNLARVTVDGGRLTLARQYAEQALGILRRVGSADNPDHMARVLNMQGEIEQRLSNTMAARSSFAEALSARERIFGATHPLAAESRAQLAVADLALGSYDDALAGALEAERAGRDHLQFTVRYLPERQAMAYAAKRPKALDTALSIAASGSTLTHTSILDALIRSRGVILDELAARSRAASAADVQVASLNQTAVQARQRFANLMVRSLQDSSSVPRTLLDEARQQKEDAERALAEKSVDGNAELMRAHIGFNEVHAALPPGAALVSFAKYQRTRPSVAGQPPRSRAPVPSYGAYVVRAGSARAEFVSIGTAAHVENLVKAWRIEAGGGSIAGGASAPEAVRAYRTAAAALRRAVWDPLTPHLSGATRTFIVGDGLLNIVNFAALPDRSGRYLVEGESVIHYLSTERDLVAADATAARRTLLAVGGPAFGTQATATPVATSARRNGCEGFGSVRFEDLPGSRREANEIAKSWPSQGPGDVTVLSGRAATETAVKRGLAGHRVVHLATHGFFLGADCSTAAPGTRAVGALTTTPSLRRASTAVENPLLLAGLAFAGANQRRSSKADQDDGILTAEEIAGLNLQGTEWAVLSACDTGLGEIRAGEGVFGLRRAFQVAGARTVIMTLWSVEDRSAMQWMRALYDGRLRRGFTTADAVRDASLTVLRQRRAHGESDHPFHWAGFVASGDWR
jgi:CHAT domain-containing protein/tetratricopeptide (TPR) repeat protein